MSLVPEDWHDPGSRGGLSDELGWVLAGLVGMGGLVLADPKFVDLSAATFALLVTFGVIAAAVPSRLAVYCRQRRAGDEPRSGAATTVAPTATGARPVHVDKLDWS